MLSGSSLPTFYPRVVGRTRVKVDQRGSRRATGVDAFFRHSGVVFLILFAVTPLVVYSVNWIQPMAPYQIAMVSIGWGQAIITSFLSFKIFEIGKRDSELPDLSYYLTDAREVYLRSADQRRVLVTMAVINRSFGRAQITDVDVIPEFDEERFREEKASGGGRLELVFPTDLPVPCILDRGDFILVEFYVDGFSYLDKISFELEEKTLGMIQDEILVSNIQRRVDGDGMREGATEIGHGD